MESTLNQISEEGVKFLAEKGITIEKYLGGGSYGHVWQILRQMENGKTRGHALKLVTVDTQLKPNQQIREIGLLSLNSDTCSDLNHLNVVNRLEMIDVFRQDFDGSSNIVRLFLFMELLDGDLYQLMEQMPNTEDFERFTHLWAKQITNGLKYLHNESVIHLNIKPQNILYISYKEDQQIKYFFKLTDFGLVNVCRPNHRSDTVYTPPEFVGVNPYESKNADIYSLGVVMAESIGANKLQLNDVLDLIRRFDSRIKTELNVSLMCCHLIGNMLSPNPMFRPTIAKVCSHYWIKCCFPQHI